MESKKLRLIEFTGRFLALSKSLSNKPVTDPDKLPNRQVTAQRRVVHLTSAKRASIVNSRVTLFICAVLLACIAKGFVQGHPWIAVCLGVGAAASVARALTMTR